MRATRSVHAEQLPNESVLMGVGLEVLVKAGSF